MIRRREKEKIWIFLNYFPRIVNQSISLWVGWSYLCHTLPKLWFHHQSVRSLLLWRNIFDRVKRVPVPLAPLRLAPYEADRDSPWLTIWFPGIPVYMYIYSFYFITPYGSGCDLHDLLPLVNPRELFSYVHSWNILSQISGIDESVKSQYATIAEHLRIEIS